MNRLRNKCDDCDDMIFSYTDRSLHCKKYNTPCKKAVKMCTKELELPKKRSDILY